MPKILLLNASPTVNGNGDTLVQAAAEQAVAAGARVQIVHARDKNIGFCKACYSCATTGVCAQKDDFAGLLALAHEADGIIAAAPIYYNCMAAQMLTVIDRLCCTFACKFYPLGPKKRVGIFLTCTGSDADEMKHHVNNILTLPSISRSIIDSRTEVFTGCASADTCRERDDYLERAREVTRWVALGEKA